MAGGQAVTSGQGSVHEGSSVPLKSRKAGTGSGTQAISGLAAFSSSGLFSPAPVSTPTGQVAALFQGSFGKQRATLLAGQASSVAPGSAGIAGSGAFALPTVSGGVTWNAPATIPPYPNSPIGINPYNGSKHTRWARRTKDQCWYVLGGDYPGTSGPPAGEAASVLWKVDTSAKPFTFTQLYGEVPPSGKKAPAHVDEAAWMYDSKRDRFLLYPNPRWPIADTADTIVGHLMSYDPNTNLWTDLGSGTYTGDVNLWDATNNPQFDVNGHQYPIRAVNNCIKWGIYDEVTDKYYLPYDVNALVVLDAATYAMEWPILYYGNNAASTDVLSANTSPYQYYDPTWFTGCICFDRSRRRLLAIKEATNGVLTDTYSSTYLAFDLDTRTFSTLQATNTPCDPLNPFYIDFEAMIHDEDNDLYVIYGGALKPGGDANQVTGTNDFRVIPGSGGTWRQLLPTDTRPLAEFGQSMHRDPRQGVFMQGGIAGVDSTINAPAEQRFPTINRSAVLAANGPAWRTSMTANTWTALASVGTMAAVNPENNPAINPNYPSSAPWHGVGGQPQIIGSWDSAVYDDVTRTMYIGPAGGHNDYWGNERYRCQLGVATPAWELVANPTGAIGNTGTLNDGLDNSGVYFDGRPRSMHTYNFPVWVPNWGQIIPVLSATSPVSGAASKVFRVDQKTGETTLLLNYSGVVTFSSTTTIPTGGSCYDSKRHCVWTLISGWSALLKYDVATRVTSIVNTSGLAFTGTGCTSATYIPEVDAILYIAAPGSAGADAASNGLTLLNLSTMLQTQITATGSFATGLGVIVFNGTSFVFTQGQLSSTQAVVGAQWDSVRHRLMLWHNASNTTVISTLTPGANYFTDTWTRGTLTVSGSNAVTPSVGTDNGTYGRFAYSRSLDGVFLLNGVSQPTYFYALS